MLFTLMYVGCAQKDLLFPNFIVLFLLVQSTLPSNAQSWLPATATYYGGDDGKGTEGTTVSPFA